MSLSICVYSASSNHIDRKYFAAAETLGRLMGEQGHTLIFGGGNIGLMNAMAVEVQKAGGRVVGVIPIALRQKKWCLESADELITTDGLRDRKAIMDERADAFIAMPGGFGTLEELLEIVTLKQLRYHAKAVVVLDVAGYYDPLLAQFEKMFAEGFARRKFADLYHVTADPAAALDYIEAYAPPARTPDTH